MSTGSTERTRALTDLVAAEIRATMGRHAVRQSELARRLGVNDTWLSVRLRGAQEIGVNDLQRIAAALEVPVADLFPREVRSPNERLATGRPAPHTVDVRSPRVAGTQRRPKIRQTLAGHPIAAHAAWPAR